MNGIARMPASKRAEVFAETADRKGLAEAIIEKDFWVCWVLKQLFSIEVFSGRLVFKGGTSLSKVFHAINRFSEDIDLAVDYAALGFRGEWDPRQERISKSRRASILADMATKCQEYIGNEFLSALRARCEEVLGPSGQWGLDVSEQDPNVVRFRYPTSAKKALAYVVPQVVLEMGTHAEFVPRDYYTIRSFAGEEFPGLVPEAEVRVVALVCKRTFWEKATILHAEYHRPLERPMPGRYSRHYYDVAMMAKSAIRDRALADMALLAQVVRHKETFYPAAWAQYCMAKAGTLRLLPGEKRRASLERDYRSMSVMIFGKPPAFGAIVEELAELEAEINS